MSTPFQIDALATQDCKWIDGNGNGIYKYRNNV